MHISLIEMRILGPYVLYSAGVIREDYSAKSAPVHLAAYVLRFFKARLMLCTTPTAESYFKPQGREFTHKSGEEEPWHANRSHRSHRVYTSTFTPVTFQSNFHSFLRT